MNKLAELLGHKQIKTIDELDLTYWQKLGEMHFNDLNKLSMKFACTKDERQDSDGKLYLIANNKRILPHIHLSIQSGDNLILKRMKRRHLREDAIDLCDQLKQKRHHQMYQILHLVKI